MTVQRAQQAIVCNGGATTEQILMLGKVQLQHVQHIMDPAFEQIYLLRHNPHIGQGPAHLRGGSMTNYRNEP